MMHTTPSADSFIHIENLCKSYHLDSGEEYPVLKGVSMDIEEGDFVAIMGRSGGGKSTFMNILGTLDHPTSGAYRLAGHDIAGLSDEALAYTRNNTIGFIFQNFNLIPRRTLLENVMMPLIYRKVELHQRKEIAMSYLELVGLADYADRMPNQLSGGMQQRGAIARALTSNPKLILADEPTGNLDRKTAADIMDLLTTINDSRITIIMVTHELKIASYARRVIHFKDGNILMEDAKEYSEWHDARKV